MKNLDRVLDGHDVHFTLRIDVVDHASQGCCLTGTGGTGDKHKAARLKRQIGDDRRKSKVAQRDSTDGNATEHQAGRTALTEYVDTEPSYAGHGVRKVRLVAAVKLFNQVGAKDFTHHVFGVV